MLWTCKREAVVKEASYKKNVKRDQNDENNA
jgi:hypothetical protein